MRNPSRVRHALSAALSVILPTPEDTLFLRACLQSGESGRQACESWLQQHAKPQNELRNKYIKAFLPLLYSAVRIHCIAVDNEFLTILRTAAVREEVRTNTYRSICRNIFSTLATNEIPTIVLRGAALADTVYAAPALRHSHDIDILLEHRYRDSTLALLGSLAFVPMRKNAATDSLNVELKHGSGLPLVLHHSLFKIPFYNPDSSELWSRSQTRRIADVAVRVLSPADAILHLCGHASYSPSRESLRWISDSWFIIHGHPDLDWDLLLDLAHQSHLTLPLSVTLGYLARELNAPVPSSFLDRLFTAASKTTAIEQELALFGARSALRGGFRNLIRKTRNWSGRALIIKWMVFPSLTYVRWVSQTRGLRLLPIQYLYRPIKYVSRRIWPSLKDVIRRLGFKELSIPSQSENKSSPRP